MARLALLLAATAVLCGCFGVSALPDNFFKETLMTKLIRPTDITFLSGPRILVTLVSGVIFIGNPAQKVDSKNMATQVYADLTDRVDSRGDKGLLDIILDREFATTRYVYLYYSRNTATIAGDSFPTNTVRVSRFKHVENSGGITSRLNLTSEEVVWVDPDGYPNLHWSYHWHFGSQMSWGPDGRLYFGQGDKMMNNQWCQDPTRYSGCMIRINRDGSFPEDNFGVKNKGGAPGCWGVKGLRNPYRSRWDLATGRLFIADVGGNNHQVSLEKLNVVRFGDTTMRNFGWPICEGSACNPDWTGSCNCSAFDAPLLTYGHKNYSACIIGGFVYRGNMFPPSFKGTYFFGEYGTVKLSYLVLDSTGTTVLSNNVFDTFPEGSPTTVEPGPAGDLYVVTAMGNLARFYYVAPPGNVTVLPPVKNSCAQQGCVFNMSFSCQCNPGCEVARTCCSDYISLCKPPVYEVRIRTSPVDFKVIVAGKKRTSPTTVTGNSGKVVSLYALAKFCKNSKRYTFSKWSDNVLTKRRDLLITKSGTLSVVYVQTGTC